MTSDSHMWHNHNILLSKLLIRWLIIKAFTASAIRSIIFGPFYSACSIRSVLFGLLYSICSVWSILFGPFYLFHFMRSVYLVCFTRFFLFGLFYSVCSIWSVLFGPFYSVHSIRPILYGPFNSVCSIRFVSFGRFTRSVLSGLLYSICFIQLLSLTLINFSISWSLVSGSVTQALCYPATKMNLTQVN